MDTQDQSLSRALLDFITPLVQTIDPKKTIDIERTLATPEAAKLVTALKEFVLSVVGNLLSTSSTSEMKMKVNLNDEGRVENTSDSTASAPRGGEVSLAPRTLQGSGEENMQYTIEQKLIEELRDHVFNYMPIRLLSFERHDTGLEIKLLERGAIISFLEPKLRRRLNAKYPTWDLSTVPTEENVFAIKGLVRQATHYAILSHTWLRSDPGEITYNDWISRSFNPDEAGYRKLANFCRVASTNHNLSIGWMDTVCINKDSSSELDESIRSMYNWYQCAKVCIIYLAETTALLDIHRDPWFTRGWTLQELIAPFVVKFYNRSWIQFIQRTNNDKPSPSFSNIIPEILQEIRKATTMSEFELVNITKAPISRRMQLAANRIVTRQEDAAYSLMGIFNVSIATAYGEGSERAFSRLLQEILNVERFGVLDIINWAGLGRSQRSHILPRSAQQYHFCSSSLDLSDVTPLEPLTLTNMGTRIFVLLMPGISIGRPTGRYQHPKVSPSGDYTATVNITDPDDNRLGIRTFHLLDRRVSGPDGGKEIDNGQLMTQNTFAVFNIEWKPGGLYIPQTCIAVVLRCFEDAGKVTSAGMFLRVYTSEPCVFKLKKRSTERRSRNTDSYVDTDEAGEVIAVEDLRKHGMQLVLKYL